MIYDPSKSADQIVYDLINRDNASDFSSETTTLSEPIEWVIPDDTYRNTKITLVAIPNKGWRSSVDLTYHRIPLSDVRFPDPYQLSPETSIEQVLDAVALDLNLVRSEIDLDVTTIPDIGYIETETTINVVAKPKSKIFIGSLPLTLLNWSRAIPRTTHTGALRTTHTGDVRTI